MTKFDKIKRNNAIVHWEIEYKIVLSRVHILYKKTFLSNKFAVIICIYVVMPALTMFFIDFFS